ncbi:hypothetical protein FRB90_005279 [Tulasnella sp. 427]|nr:hypothetical protein FRB90_005279 [Tulasnella sp. 427]
MAQLARSPQNASARSPQNASVLLLPDDLTSNIFLICHQDDAQNSATRVIQVCAQWREFALTMPGLWSSIEFGESLQVKGVIQEMEMKLRRASVSLLDITILYDAVYKPAVKNMMQILRLISPTVERWRSLTIARSTSHTAIRYLFDELATVSAPQLERLHIKPETPSRGIDEPTRWRFRAFGGDLPALHYLELSRCKVDWNSSIFHNLLDLEIQDHQLGTADQSTVISLVRDLIVRAP